MVNNKIKISELAKDFDMQLHALLLRILLRRAERHGQDL